MDERINEQTFILSVNQLEKYFPHASQGSKTASQGSKSASQGSKSAFTH